MSMKIVSILVVISVSLFICALCTLVMSVVFFPIMHSVGLMSDVGYGRFISLLETL